MQQIERYGVIALVFLLVTIVAVSFWGDNKSPGFWSRLTGRGDAKKTAIVEANPLQSVNPPANVAERALQNPLPLSPADDAARDAFASQLAPAPTAGIATGNAAQPVDVAALPHASEPLAYEQPTSPAVAPSYVDEPAPSQITHTPAPKVANTAKQDGAFYVVQKGDSLARIAQNLLGATNRWTEIQALNGGVDPKSLRVGMKLKLPAGAKSTATKSNGGTQGPAKSKSAPSKANATYIVKGGDSLTRIAARELGDGSRWKEIAALNPSVNPNRLLVGKSLKLPVSETRSLVAAAVPQSNRNADKPRVR